MSSSSSIRRMCFEKKQWYLRFFFFYLFLLFFFLALVRFVVFPLGKSTAWSMSACKTFLPFIWLRGGKKSAIVLIVLTEKITRCHPQIERKCEKDENIIDNNRNNQFSNCILYIQRWMEEMCVWASEWVWECGFVQRGHWTSTGKSTKKSFSLSLSSYFLPYIFFVIFLIRFHSISSPRTDSRTSLRIWQVCIRTGRKV